MSAAHRGAGDSLRESDMTIDDILNVAGAVNPAPAIIVTPEQCGAAFRAAVALALQAKPRTVSGGPAGAGDALILVRELRLWPDSRIMPLPIIPAGCTVRIETAALLSAADLEYLSRWALVARG